MTHDSVDVFALPVVERLTPMITLRGMGDLPLVVVEHPQARAAVTLQGAQLIAWQPTGERPVLWLSADSAFTEGKAVRGGVPICWPWFGSAGKPSHGFARITTWTLSSHEEDADADAAHLTLTLRSTPQTRELWPHDFTLTARFTLGRQCEIDLQAEGDYTSTGALHSYLHVGAAAQTRVSGLGDHYIDKVRDGVEGVQKGDLTFPDHIDRIYTRPEKTALVQDPVMDRVIEVQHHSASDTVTWNPGPALARTMTDVPDEGYTAFVCVESARITHPLTSTEDSPAHLGVTLSMHR